jgi:RNA polymerase sigma factor (sigma-70 family)
MEMVSMADSGTRVSLLGRLRRDPTNETAWAEFVDVYAPKLMAWCQKWNLQEADAQDVTQNVLVRLAEKLRDFDYDPTKSFRAWLKTVAQHACSDFLQRKNRPGVGSGDSQVGRLLLNAEAREDLVKHLEQEFDHEILEVAMLRVRLRVAPQTWEAFWLTAFEGLPGAEAAVRIPMQVAQVYVAKRRVQKMLQEEVARLEGPEAKEG